MENGKFPAHRWLMLEQNGNINGIAASRSRDKRMTADPLLPFDLDWKDSSREDCDEFDGWLIPVSFCCTYSSPIQFSLDCALAGRSVVSFELSRRRVQIVGANATFTAISVQHHWVTENGETLNVAPATFHGMFVGSGLLAVTEYTAHLSGGTGRFANANGDMSFIGEIDLNSGHVVLRYSGAVCVAGRN
jgi:hypothetical protein